MQEFGKLRIVADLDLDLRVVQLGAGVSPTVRFVAVFGLEVRLVVGFLVVVFAVDFATVLVVFVAAALAVVFAVAFVRGVALDDVASFI